jgi:hypothetical protein
MSVVSFRPTSVNVCVYLHFEPFLILSESDHLFRHALSLRTSAGNNSAVAKHIIVKNFSLGRALLKAVEKITGLLKLEKNIIRLLREELCMLTAVVVNHLTPELNPSAQRCLKRLFTGDFAA